MKKILCFTLLVFMVMSSLSFSASATEERVYSDDYYNPRFEDAFVRLGYQYEDYFDCEGFIELYYELMAYKNGTVVEYTLVFPQMQAGFPREGYDQIGEYVVSYANVYRPYRVGWYVYSAIDDKVYTLTEAYNMNMNGITEAFECLTENGFCAIAGDVDCDGKLSVKDATMLQKQIAGIVSNDPFVEIKHMTHMTYFGAKDINMDVKIDVKDVTAIQKRVAGIE